MAWSWYTVGIIIEENSVVFLIGCTRCLQQGHMGSKRLLQQNSLVYFNHGCRLTQLDLYYGRKIVVAIGKKLLTSVVDNRVVVILPSLQHNAMYTYIKFQYSLIFLLTVLLSS